MDAKINFNLLFYVIMPPKNPNIQNQYTGQNTQLMDVITENTSSELNPLLEENPWEDIKIDDYEGHMNLDSVNQLPVLNWIINSQLNDYNTNSVCIFWIAGWNWLEHIDKNKYQKVYAIDINEWFLEVTKNRFSNLLEWILECKKLDLSKEFDKLPNADIVIANLLIEYIWYDSFQKAIQKVNPMIVSCVIQVDTNKGCFISDSPYTKAFDKLDEVHHEINEETLIQRMGNLGYNLRKKEDFDLINGKIFIRLDFKKWK